MISVPQKFCDTLKSLHREFIWNDKKAEIKHSSLIGEYRNGELKDVDIDGKILSLKILWVRQLKDSNFHPLKVLANHLLSPVGLKQFFTQTYAFQKGSDKERMICHYFIRTCFKSWGKYSVSRSLAVGKLPHSLCGTMSLYIQNLRAFTMNR